MRLAIITGTRPELIRLSKIINKARKYYEVTHIYTNQNFDASLSEQFFEEFDIFVDIKIGNEEKLTGVKFISHCMTQLNIYFSTFNYDAVLVLGDTNSAFAAVSVAKRLGIPIFHMEAGNRCYDPERVPEEVNRYQIDAIADWHLCYTQRAREQLLLEGHHPSKVVVVGNPIYEVVNQVLLSREIKEPYYLATIHRKENIDGRLYDILETLNELDCLVLISAHPTVKDKINEFIKARNLLNLETFIPTNFNDFINLENTAKCVITDSGTVPEECMILQTPCVLLRYSTERPELLETNSMVVCSKLDELKTAIKIAEEQDSDLIDSNYHNGVTGNVLKILMRTK